MTPDIYDSLKLDLISKTDVFTPRTRSGSGRSIFYAMIDYPELIQRITHMSPELMYRGKMLVDVTDVLDIIRDARRESDSILQNTGVEKMPGSVHESNSGIMRALSAKGHLLTSVHRPSQETPDT